MGRIVTVAVVDLTRPVAQKGFKSVALVDLTSDLTTATITDTKTLTAGSDALKFASAFFANGGSSLLVCGKAITNENDIATFLNTVSEANDFYGITVICPKDKQATYLEHIKTFVEGNKKLAIAEVNGNAIDVGTGFESMNSDRVVLYANSEDAQNGCAAAVSGACFPQDEGSITWGNKAIVSVEDSKYSLADEITLLAKNINYITRESGLVLSQFGKTTSGSNADITRSKDFLVDRLSGALTSALVNAKKIGFTTADLGRIAAAMDEVGVQAVNQGMLSEFYSVVPEVSAIPTNDKANRVLRGCKFIATLSGAVETIELELQVKL